MTKPLTLARLSSETGVPVRTIRSWVAEQLVPGPLSRGRGATYPEEALERVHRVRQLRETGLSAEEIRREQAFGFAKRPREMGYPEPEYLISAYRLESPIEEKLSDPPSGFSTLAERLGVGDEYLPDAGARSSDWVSFEVSPDVEVNVRGPLSEQQRTLIARCAAAIGKILVSQA